MKIYIYSVALLFASNSFAADMHLFKNLNRDNITASIAGSNINDVSSALIQLMIDDRYSIDKQTNNTVEFSKTDTGALAWVSRSIDLQQSETVNCSLTRNAEDVLVSCRIYNVAVNKDGRVNRDDQTHVRKVRRRLSAKLDALTSLYVDNNSVSVRR